MNACPMPRRCGRDKNAVAFVVLENVEDICYILLYIVLYSFAACARKVRGNKFKIVQDSLSPRT